MITSAMQEEINSVAYISQNKQKTKQKSSMSSKICTTFTMT